MTTPQQRRQLESLSRDELAQLQLEKLNRLLGEVLPSNGLYANKLAPFSAPLKNLDELSAFPMTTKAELHPISGRDPFAANRTYPIERYVRFHQTSGTRGHPLVVLDTKEDWQWWIDAWQFVLDGAEITSQDRLFLAFSFGPFIGFWSAFDAITARGALAIPGGGMNTRARLELLERAEVTALCCTPTYALHLAEVAAEQNLPLAKLPVKKIIVAGEPGGSVPSTRTRIETAWDAEVVDHAGATEVGPWGYSDRQGGGLHVLESEFLAEFISAETGEPAQSGELAHLVLTTLGRAGCPLFRYRTGDLVRPSWPQEGTNRFVFLEGGVLGRADDMMIVRGMNIFPSSIDQILHSFPEVVEYRLTVRKQGALDTLSMEVEDHLLQPERIAEELQLKLGLKVDVHAVPAMSLPRFDGKGKRFLDLREQSG